MEAKPLPRWPKGCHGRRMEAQYAYFERPVNNRLPRRPLCDSFEHAQNFTATIMVSMAMSERPVYHP